MVSFFVFFPYYFVYYSQNKRGGQVKLQSILMPFSEFDHAEKGDALYGEFKLLEPHITSSLCIHKNKMFS